MDKQISSNPGVMVNPCFTRQLVCFKKWGHEVLDRPGGSWCIIPFLPDDATCEVEAYEVGGPKGAAAVLVGVSADGGSSHRGCWWLPLEPKTMKNEGFTPQILGYNP